MSEAIEAYSPPPIPPRVANARTFQDLRDGTRAYLSDIANYHVTYFTRLGVSHNKNSQGFGPNLASAATIQVTGDLQQIVTGTATIQTIQPPPGFNGLKALYAQNGFSLGTAGNIATAFTADPGNLIILLYFPPTQKWAVIAAAFVGTLDGIPDGTNFAKVSVSALTGNNVDLNKAGVVNKSQVAAANGAGVNVNGLVHTAGLAPNAATYSANSLFSGSILIDGTNTPPTHYPFDTWIDVPSTSFALAINAATDAVYLNSQVDVSWTGLQPGNTIQHRFIDDLGNTYVNPLTNISVQASLDSNASIQGLTTADAITPPAGAYPATRTYHVQVQAHQAIATFTATFTKVKAWGIDARA